MRFFILLCAGVLLGALPAFAVTRVGNDWYEAGAQMLLFEQADVEDAFLMGEIVAVRSELLGDGVFVASSTLDVAGRMQDMRAAAAERVTVTGGMTSAVILGGEVVLEPTAQIAGDAYIVAQRIVVRGTIGGNAVLRGREIIFEEAGKVQGDVHIVAGSSLALSREAVGGNLAYTAPEEVAGLSNATYTAAAQQETRMATVVLMLALTVLIAGMVVLTVMKEQAIFFAGQVRTAFWQSFLAGILGLFVPLLGLALLLIPGGGVLGVISIVSAILLYMMAFSVAGFALMAAVLPVRGELLPVLLLLAVGTGILCLLLLIPPVGLIFGLLAFVLSLGALLRVLLGMYKA